MKKWLRLKVKPERTRIARSKIIGNPIWQVLILWLCFSFFSISQLSAQTYFFKTLSIESGLPVNSIKTIFEDSRSYIWVGCDEAGLVRYNGRSFTRVGGNSPLASSTVTSILEDQFQEMWVGTDGKGLFKIAGDTIIHFTEENSKLAFDRVSCIEEDENGSIWVGTTGGGLSVKHPGVDTFETYSFWDGLNSNRITSLWANPNGDLWIGQFNGFQVLRSGEFVSPKQSQEELGPVYQFIEDSNGSLMICQGGVYALEEGSIKFSLWLPTEDKRITKGIIVNKNAYWFSGKQGLFFWNGVSWTHYNEKNGLPDNQINDLLLCQDQSLWIASQFRGLNIFGGKAFSRFGREQGLEEEVVLGLEEKGEETLIGTNNGLFLQAANQVKRLNLHPKLSKSAIVDIQQSKEGTFFATQENGLFQMVGKNTKQYLEDKGLSSSQLTCLESGKNGKLWVGTLRGGLNLFEDGQFLHITRKDGLPSGQVKDLSAKPNGDLYILTGAGLAFLRRDKTEIDSLDVLLGEFNCLSKVSKMRLALGKRSGEILLLLDMDIRNTLVSPSEKPLSHLHFLDDELFAVYGDELYAYQLRDNPLQNWRKFTKDQGFAAARTMPQAFLATTKGVLLFGTINGLLEFHPSLIESQSEDLKPKIWLDGVKLNRRKTDWADRGFKTNPWNGVPINPVLSPKERQLEFDLFSENKSNINQLFFSYRVEGVDQTWSEPSTSSTILYSSLPAGKHELHVKAINQWGIQSQILTYPFTIRKHFWQTNMFRFLALLVLILAGYIWYRLRTQRLKLKQQQLEIQVANRTRDLKKSLEELNATQEQLVAKEKLASLGELTAGIAHEIKNPLNFITNFSSLNKELAVDLKEIMEQKEMTKEDQEEIREIIDDLANNSEKISNHGRRADSIVKGMLAHSRKGNSQKELTDVNKLIDEQWEFALEGFKAKGGGIFVKCQKNYQPGLSNLAIYPQDLSRVFLNLFNNALFALAERSNSDPGFQSEISIQTEEKGSNLAIKIRDNGPGIPENLKAKIFDPFFTTKPTGEGNTGLGLSLSHDIITKQHGGNLEVESEKDNFTQFTILLPLESRQ